MSNHTSTIDLTMLNISLTALKEQLQEDEFEDFLDLLVEANQRGKLVEFLDLTSKIRYEGTDLASSLNHAHFDLFVASGENLEVIPKSKYVNKFKKISKFKNQDPEELQEIVNDLKRLVNLQFTQIERLKNQD